MKIHEGTFGLDALHDALDAGGTEVVQARFHNEAIDTNNFRLALRISFAMKSLRVVLASTIA